MGKVQTAEYYFEYQIEKVFGSESIATPKLYFERDYYDKNMTYCLFSTFEEWNGKSDIYLKVKGEKSTSRAESIAAARDFLEVKREALAALPFDSAVYTFDVKGIDCASLSDIEGQTYRVAEFKPTTVITFEKYWQEKCRFILENKGAVNQSGTGIIEYYKGEGSEKHLVAKFFFAINYTIRKKIFYTLEVSGENVHIKAKCKDAPQGIYVNLIFNNDRLPCLAGDAALNRLGDPIELIFNKKGIAEATVRLDDPELASAVFSLSFTDEPMKRFYLLESMKNESVKIPPRSTYLYPRVLSCPYCHKPIKSFVKKHFYYLSRGISCQGNDAGKESDVKWTEHPKIYTSSGKFAKRTVYCQEDLKISSGKIGFQPNYERTLPLGYLEHECFKIAFTGSTRSGKTTYISRFFDIISETATLEETESSRDVVIHDRKVCSMSCDMLKNSLNKFKIRLKAASVNRLVSDGRGGYKMMDQNWTEHRKEYDERSIDIVGKKFPNATTDKDVLTRLPFTVEVGGKNYVSFYDIAGENAESEWKMTQKISGGAPIGVFFIVNGKKDGNGLKNVAETLQSAIKTKENEGLDPESPIAVILTKMDLLRDKFDSNCHCLRTDYLSYPYSRYEGSWLEHSIDYSSEEIKSYLINEGLLPNLDKYKNIKFFSIAAFNFFDSIHRDGESEDDIGVQRFGCSGQRIELPFIWMLKQFGVIN